VVVKVAEIVLPPEWDRLKLLFSMAAGPGINIEPQDAVIAPLLTELLSDDTEKLMARPDVAVEQDHVPGLGSS
jgi:hypothetical protein